MTESEAGYWERLLLRVGEGVADLPDPEYVIEGYQHLRTVFEPEPGPVFLDYIQNRVPEALAESAYVGHLLSTIRSDLAPVQFEYICQRLRSSTTSDVDGVLAELRIFGALRDRHLPVRFIRATNENVAADILIGGIRAVEVEVSHLGVPQTYFEAETLHEELRQTFHAILGPRSLYVDVSLDGFAADLRARVADAEIAFRAMLESPPASPREIVPGFTFVTENCSVPLVHVHGARVHGPELFGRGSPFARLLRKLRRESVQVKDGGVVLIHTAELSTLLEPSVLSALIEHVLQVGADSPNVGAFAVLDEVRGNPAPSEDVLASDAAEVTAATKGLTIQTMLWVRNAHATVQEQPIYRQWFKLPL